MIASLNLAPNLSNPNLLDQVYIAEGLDRDHTLMLIRSFAIQASIVVYNLDKGNMGKTFGNKKGEMFLTSVFSFSHSSFFSITN